MRDVSLDISRLGVTSSYARYGVSFVCKYSTEIKSKREREREPVLFDKMQKSGKKENG